MSARRPESSSEPINTSQTRAVLSAEAVTTDLPFGLKVAEWTRPLWRSGWPTSFPLAASHTRAAPPSLPTTNLPSGLKSTEVTPPSWRRGGPTAFARQRDEAFAASSHLDWHDRGDHFDRLEERSAFRRRTPETASCLSASGPGSTSTWRSLSAVIRRLLETFGLEGEYPRRS